VGGGGENTQEGSEEEFSHNVCSGLGVCFGFTAICVARFNFVEIYAFR